MASSCPTSESAAVQAGFHANEILLSDTRQQQDAATAPLSVTFDSAPRAHFGVPERGVIAAHAVPVRAAAVRVHAEPAAASPPLVARLHRTGHRKWDTPRLESVSGTTPACRVGQVSAPLGPLVVHCGPPLALRAQVHAGDDAWAWIWPLDAPAPSVHRLPVGESALSACIGLSVGRDAARGNGGHYLPMTPRARPAAVAHGHGVWQARHTLAADGVPEVHLTFTRHASAGTAASEPFTAGGHSPYDAVADAILAGRGRITGDAHGIPRTAQGAMAVRGPVRPNAYTYTWTDAARFLAWNAAPARPHPRPREVHPGFQTHGVSTGDPAAQWTRPAGSGPSYDTLRAHAHLGTDAAGRHRPVSLDPPALAWVGVTGDAPVENAVHTTLDGQRRVRRAPVLQVDRLRLRTAAAAVGGAAGCGQPVLGPNGCGTPSAEFDSPCQVGPSCGKETSEEVMVVAESAFSDVTIPAGMGVSADAGCNLVNNYGGPLAPARAKQHCQ